MITHGHSVPLLLSYHIVVWSAWLLITVAVVALVQRWPIIPPTRLNVMVHVLTATVASVLHVVFWLAMLVLMQPFDRMTAAAEQIDVPAMLFSRFLVEITVYAAVLAAVQAIDYYDK
jgi:hypothetical protein